MKVIENESKTEKTMKYDNKFRKNIEMTEDLEKREF